MEPYQEFETAGENSSSSNGSLRRYLYSATAVLILVNVLIFLKTDFFNILGGEDIWIDKGCLSCRAFFNAHEYYRIITCMFLHGGIDHIFNNMLCLFFLGTFLEQQIGTPRFTILYFSSGIIAGFTSMVYNIISGTDTASIGASGAIFGITGGLLALVLFHRDKIDLDYRQLIFAVFLSLYSGFMDQNVDNAAHVGGFLGGLLIGLIAGTGRHHHASDRQTGTDPTHLQG